MRNQHLDKSPAIEVYGHCRLLLPWPSVSCWFFLQSRVEKLLAGDWTHNLRYLFSVSCLWPLSHGDPYFKHVVYFFADREYECLGQWEENNLLFTYTRRKDLQSLECFVGSTDEDGQLYLIESGPYCKRGLAVTQYGMELHKTSWLKANYSNNINKFKQFFPNKRQLQGCYFSISWWKTLVCAKLRALKANLFPKCWRYFN